MQAGLFENISQGDLVWLLISIATFTIGVGIICFQAITAVIMAIINILLSIFLMHRFGLPGPIWETVISYTISALIPVAIYTKNLLDKTNSSNIQPNFK